MDRSPNYALVLDNRSSALLERPPVTWAVEQLRNALASKDRSVEIVSSIEAASATSRRILVAAGDSALARGLLDRSGLTLPDAAEALALLSGRIDDREVVLATGRDERGIVYALLELADRVSYSADPEAALQLTRPIAEKPANPIRSVTRLFVSDVEDKSWFDDRDFWRNYLSMLAAQRFNRFSLAFGIGHDFLRNVTDAYLLFAYPFLVDVPGYPVRASGLSDAERERNLATLRFIGEETKRRGLHFQLGLWTHGYEWIDSPRPNYTIEGLTAETHAAYCRDALRTLLTDCPTIDGVTLRVHGESGVPEGNYDFWETVFQGIVDCGRRVEIDMHPKGIDPEMIAVGLRTGLPVRLSPKYTAEHMGLPYQQASIRDLERNTRRPEGDAFIAHLMNRSAGAGRYTRYGYADFLREDRQYGVYFRIWPGTQRLLLWGDPALAAGFGRHAQFCGCQGIELCEPLSFKGRRGSGLPGGRDGYLDHTLRPAGGDWEKYLYTYRLFGRLLYNPDAEPEGWRRYLDYTYGPAASGIEQALAAASRVLPLITTAHHVSAANNRFWPEIYTNMPIVDPNRPHPYGDTPSPKRFGTVSALDPGLFSSIDEFADEVVDGRPSGKYPPVQVARWLDGLADEASRHLALATAGVRDPLDPAFRRTAIDVEVQIGLARFFAHKLRAGVAYALGVRTQSSARIREALEAYRLARTAWAEIAARTRNVYREDLTVGGEPWLRGHWADRLAAIDDDLADLEGELTKYTAAGLPSGEAVVGGTAEDLAAEPPAARYGHEPPGAFRAGDALALTLSVRLADDTAEPSAVDLHYRHVNQAESYRVVAMERDADGYHATIPGAYTDSSYPLQYYFTIRGGNNRAWLHPGFAPDLANQPYFVVRQMG